jgi:homoserine kinase
MLEIRSDVQSVTAFAPATCANLAVGYDILGCALEGIGDTIRLERRDDDQLVVAEITGIVESDSLPYEASRNTATAVIQKILSDYQLSAGFTVYLHKGIPLGSGLGGSAASTVAALVAFNGFLASPISLDELGRYALFGEEVATGVGHGDNIVVIHTQRYHDQPLVVQGPGAGASVTAAGVFADMLRLISQL